MQIKTLALIIGLSLSFSAFAEESASEPADGTATAQEPGTGSRIRRLAPLTVNPTAVSHRQQDARSAKALKQEDQDAFLDGVRQ